MNRLLAGITLASVALLALRISQDIVFGFDRAGLNHLVGVGILLVITCGAVLLPHRPRGTSQNRPSVDAAKPANDVAET